MPLNFPSNPALNQYYVFNGIRWRWNGYAWLAAGVCGAGGVFAGISGDYVSGITGGAGVTVSGPTGLVEVSLRLDEPNVGTPYIPTLHNAPTIFSADSGYARKVAFLQSDGSVQFDYIKNYDVFRQAEFNFDILTFNIAQPNGTPLNPQLIGLQNQFLNLDPYDVYLGFNQSPSSLQIDLVGGLDGQGFPVFPPTFNTIYNFSSGQNLIYNTLTYSNQPGQANGDYQILRLGATGDNANGTTVYRSKDYFVYFYNYVFVGQSTSTTITSSDFSGFTPILNGSRSYVINAVVEGEPPRYLYYAYPSRLGTAVFRDNATNIEGGFTQQIVNGVSTFSYTNPKGYTENYTIFRSDNANLGSISITVS